MTTLESQRRAGLLFCLASAAGFGAMAIIAKAAYAGGADDVPSLLTVRFGLAAMVLWALVAVRARRGAGASPAARRSLVAPAASSGTSPLVAVSPAITARPALRAGLRSAAPGLLLGGLYAVEAGSFFFALSRIDAGLAELLLYGYPAIVVLGAALLGRERLTARRCAALGLATTGVAFVLLGGSLGSVDLIGVAAALACSVLYAGYTLAGETLVARTEPVLLTAQITTGAALAVGGFALGHGGLQLGFGAGGWAAALALVALCTVLPVLAFLAGVRQVGSAMASVVSTVEPLITVSLALLVLGERMGPGQLAGGGLVLAALLVLAGPLRRPARRRAPAEPALTPAFA